MKQSQAEQLEIYGTFLRMNLFEDYCRQVKVDNFWNNNFIEYESDVDTNKTSSINNLSNQSILDHT